MRYLIRAAKYFVQLMVILTLLIAILMVAKVADTDISQLFVNGYDSLWQIALLMAVFALLYPKLGYARREALAPGPDEHVEPLLEKVMTAHGYAREKRADGVVAYRKISFGDRLLRIWEDRITVTRIATGFELEGLNRDAVRLCNAIRDLALSD